MAGKVYDYEGKEITVRYDVKRCIHAEECVRGLPAVFDPDKRPWIEPDRAAPDEVAEVVLRCPTGALSMARQDGGTEEVPPERNEIRVAADGPLYVRGAVEIGSADGSVEMQESRAALCRCGESANKPFCDNSHQKSAFQDGGQIEDDRLGRTEQREGAGELRITLAANGPLLLAGPVELHSADGDVSYRGSKGALCRCGASASKPYCDGSHVAIGFEG